MNRTAKNLIILFLIITAAASALYFTLLKGESKQNSGSDYKNSSYNADSEIKSSLKNLESNPEKAAQTGGVNAAENVAALTFEGMSDNQTTKQLLELLNSYGVKAAFFLPGIKAAEDPDTVKEISQAGQIIGNYALNADKHMQKLSQAELVENFCRTSVILKNITKKVPVFLKCNLTDYTGSLLEAAGASGLQTAVNSDYYLNYQSFSSEKNAYEFVRKIQKGSVISVKLDSILEQSEYDKGKKTEVKNTEASVTKTALIKKNTSYEDRNKKLIEVVGFLLKALKENNYNIVAIDELAAYKNDEHKNENSGEPGNTLPNAGGTRPYVNDIPKDYRLLRTLNAGKKAAMVSKIYTSQPSVCYIFRGISDRNALNSVLDELDALDAKATFFVTGREILYYKANVDEIIKRGHQICNGGYGMKNSSEMDFNAICYDIDMGERCLKQYLGSRYDESINKYYMPFSTVANEELLEAAKVLGYDSVISYGINPVSGKYRNMSSDEIIKAYYGNTVALQRGDIVYFRLDYLTKRNAVGELVYKTAMKYIKKAPYDISTVHEMLASNKVYIPLSKEQAVSNDPVKITHNYLREKLFSLITGNFIGNPNITTSKGLIGFTDEEISSIDKTGKIDTKGEKVIFLTFDDWGYDDNITHILKVLKKYNVKATFFVRVGHGNVSYDTPMSNPNLLRAMAEDGHDIGNHTFSHMKVDILTAQEQSQLQKDIVAANNEMERYIGDTGNLKLYFRPPTLSVSRLGLETIFNCGYKYIVNGDFDPHDYKVKSAGQLVTRMINGIDINGDEPDISQATRPEDILKISPGSVVVMHMQENAGYTPEALDTVIPYYISKGYKFAKLSDYLTY